MSGGAQNSAGDDGSQIPSACCTLHRALAECHRRNHNPRQRELTCRHLNRSLAQCLVAAACPGECEAVRSMCSSAGTSMKRAQCQQAKISLSLCISSLQED